MIFKAANWSNLKTLTACRPAGVVRQNHCEAVNEEVSASAS